MKNNQEKSKIKNKNGGITLIALVITIIVLLILAGVTIVTLTGDNGLIAKSNNAKIESIIAGEKEKIRLAYNEYKTRKYTEKNPELTVEGATTEGTESTGWTITFADNRYSLSADGKIEKQDPVIIAYINALNTIAANANEYLANQEKIFEDFPILQGASFDPQENYYTVITKEPLYFVITQQTGAIYLGTSINEAFTKATQIGLLDGRIYTANGNGTHNVTDEFGVYPDEINVPCSGRPNENCTLCGALIPEYSQNNDGTHVHHKEDGTIEIEDCDCYSVSDGMNRVRCFDCGAAYGMEQVEYVSNYDGTHSAYVGEHRVIFSEPCKEGADCEFCGAHLYTDEEP